MLDYALEIYFGGNTVSQKQTHTDMIYIPSLMNWVQADQATDRPIAF